MHYAEVEKLGLKWSTLTSNFSTHFRTQGAKFLTGMSQLPKNLKTIGKKKSRKTGKKSYYSDFECFFCHLLMFAKNMHKTNTFAFSETNF